MGRLTLAPVPGRVWSTTLPGLVSGFRSLLWPAEGLPQVITLSSYPCPSPRQTKGRPGQSRSCTRASVLGQGQQVRVLPPPPISWTTRVRAGVSGAQPSFLRGTSKERGSRVLKRYSVIVTVHGLSVAWRFRANKFSLCDISLEQGVFPADSGRSIRARGRVLGC